MIVFWHGELGINSPKLLERLRSLGFGHAGGSEAARSESEPILQRFSWGPETYALIVIVADIFLYLISTAHGPNDFYSVVAIAAGGFVLLLVRTVQRINRRKIFILPSERRASPARVKVSSRFLQSSAADLASVTFEWPHLGYIIMASFSWSMGVILVPLALNTDSSGSLNRTEIGVILAILAALCAAMAANVIRTKVFLFRCFIPTGGRHESWIYISAHDAWWMVMSSEKTLERTCFVDRAGAAVLARTLTDAHWQLGRHRLRR